MRRIHAFAVALLTALTVAVGTAQANSHLEPILNPDGSLKTDTAGGGLSALFGSLSATGKNLIYGITGLASLWIIWRIIASGIEISNAGGDPRALASAKQSLMVALVGAAIVIAAVSLFLLAARGGKLLDAS